MIELKNINKIYKVGGEDFIRAVLFPPEQPFSPHPHRMILKPVRTRNWIAWRKKPFKSSR